MNVFSIAFLEAHAVAVWIVFLAPVFVVLLRGAQLEARRQGPVNLNPALYFVWVPVFGLVVAVMIAIRAFWEFSGSTPPSHNATW